MDIPQHLDARPFGLEDLDDDALMLRVRRMDDTEAFEVLVRRYAPYARRIFLGYFRCGADVEDLVQNLFLRVFQARRRYRPHERFRSWFYRVAINVAHDEYRKQRRARRRRWRLRRSSGGFGPPPVAGGEQETKAVRSSTLQQVERWIETLPERQRQVLILRYVEELSLAEIAEILGLKVGSVKSTLHHAHRKLQTRMKQEPMEQRNGGT